jgi:hypothetical protein
MSDQPERSRTIRWEDPKQFLEPSRSLSELEFLQMIVRRELPGPPISALMGFSLAPAATEKSS